MHKFIVAIAFIFHGQHGAVKFTIVARDAEQASRIGFRLSHDVGCLWDARPSHCVGPASVAVRVRTVD